MHYGAKRGFAIACRLSVRLSVCDVGGSGPAQLSCLPWAHGRDQRTDTDGRTDRPTRCVLTCVQL